jgi:hypothetical protein
MAAVSLKQINPERLYTVKELCRLLAGIGRGERLTSRTVCQWIKSGQLKARKIGRWLVTGQEVLDFLQVGQQKPESRPPEGPRAGDRTVAPSLSGCRTSEERENAAAMATAAFRADFVRRERKGEAEEE